MGDFLLGCNMMIPSLFFVISEHKITKLWQLEFSRNSFCNNFAFNNGLAKFLIGPLVYRSLQVAVNHQRLVRLQQGPQNDGVMTGVLR